MTILISVLEIIAGLVTFGSVVRYIDACTSQKLALTKLTLAQIAVIRLGIK